MNPLRSISMLPKIGESQGQERPFDETTYVNNGKHIQNYQAYNTELNYNNVDISWLTDVPDEKVFLEVSFKDSSSNQFISRKFDFGNFLRYIGNCLSVLEKGINDVYLTEKRADELYLPIGGGILTGPLTIAYTNKTSPALKINATDSVGAKCGVVVYGDIELEGEGLRTKLTYQTIETNKLTANAELKTGTLTATGNANIGGTLTANNLTGNAIKSNGNINATGGLTANSAFSLGTKLSYSGTSGSSIVVDAKLKTNGGIENTSGDITNVNSKITTKELTVNETTTFNKDVIVGRNLEVTGTSTLGTSASSTGDITSSEGKLKGQSAEIANQITAGSLTATGTIQGGTVKSNDQTYMDANGLHATKSISELTAQYACWA